MPEHLRALMVILALASLVFAFSKRLACSGVMAPSDFERRRNQWLAITLVVFVCGNFWLFVIATLVLLRWMLSREPNKLALFFFLLFAVPMFTAEVSGLGIIQHLVTVDYVRLLTVAVLLPEFFALRRRDSTNHRTSLQSTSVSTQQGGSAQTWADRLLVSYLILQFVLMLRVDTLTNSVRYGVIYGFVDVYLPYYVASRSLRRLEDFRNATMAFVVAALVLAAIAAFEFARHWLLYSALQDALNVRWTLGNYLDRGDSLRAIGTTGQPIPLGYVMAVALGFLLYLRPSVANPRVWLLGVVGLVVGLLAPLSRGPWIGAVAILGLFLASGPNPFKALTKLSLAGLLAVPVLLVLPAGQVIIDHLPFVGNVDAKNVTYRQRLLDVSYEVILQNPLFGAVDFAKAPAMNEMKQGDGFIDFVNSYLGIALASGLVGLSLFVGFFAVAGAGVVVGMLKTRAIDPADERYLLGRALFSTLVGILITIFTVSSITIIPVIYWSVAGLAVAYARLVRLGEAVTPVPVPVPVPASKDQRFLSASAGGV